MIRAEEKRVSDNALDSRSRWPPSKICKFTEIFTDFIIDVPHDYIDCGDYKHNTNLLLTEFVLHYHTTNQLFHY